MPWKPQQLAQMLAKQWQAEAVKSGNLFDKNEYEKAWREVYAAYKWLCKIKHPTLRSALHDSFAASVKDGEYVIMAAPDLRAEDLPVKATILVISISRVREAIRCFAIALNCDSSSPDYEDFRIRMVEILPETREAYSQTMTQPLPFIIGDSSLYQDWVKLKTQLK
ncbi:MAG: hypothetical protein MN733_19625 [Nitrososphaera sp.]|nr:hypothetical protein [Nitrososphaera sp.]